MRIAIVAPSPIPFTPGGAEALWAGLYHELRTGTGHSVEMIKVPIRETTLPEVMAAYRSFAELNLDHFDMVISGKYPAWMVAHPHHVVYMLHPLRGLYDTYPRDWPTEVAPPTDPGVRRILTAARRLRDHAGLAEVFGAWQAGTNALGADDPVFAFPGPLARILVRAMDAAALRPGAVRRHFAISRTVAGRPGYFPRGVRAGVVYTPPDLTGLHEAPGEYFFTTSRHDTPKRLDLLIEAMKHYPGKRRLLIGGSGPQTHRLAALAAGDNRIELIGRLSHEDLIEHYARSIGVPFIPLDEDLGLITIEAMKSGKPVLTARDSGGPTEFVQPGRNGVVVEPTPEAVGAGLAALERLAAQPSTATLARRTVERVTWRNAADELLRPAATARTARSRRPRLVVTSTFPFWPPQGGGQLRAVHLYGALADRFDIHAVCLTDPFTPASVTEWRPGFTEHVIPRSQRHQAQEDGLSAEAGFPVTDIVAGALIGSTPAYLATLAELLAGAAGALLAHPFLYPALGQAGNRAPVIYDAHNCEYALKSQLLPRTAGGIRLAEQVREVEGAAVAAAGLVLPVSAEDETQLRRLYGAPAEKFMQVPNGVDVTAVPFTSPSARRMNRDTWLSRLRSRDQGAGLTSMALFIGSWHPPNNEAGHFIASMAPALPHTAFLLAGEHCRTLADLRLPANVFLLGRVSEAAKKVLLAAVDVALAPLSTGSGTNLKVVEYLAAGIPVVSTPVGARGLDIDPSVIRRAPLAEFAAVIADELAHPEMADERVTLGRQAVEQRYDWGALGRLVIPRLERALGIPPSVSAAGQTTPPGLPSQGPPPSATRAPVPGPAAASPAAAAVPSTPSEAASPAAIAPSWVPLGGRSRYRPPHFSSTSPGERRPRRKVT